MFFPFSDDDRKLTKPAYATWAILLLNILIFGLQLADPSFTFGYSAIPAEITSGEDFLEPIAVQVSPGKTENLPNAPGPTPIQLTLLTSMFMHAGLAHLGGNMLFLWIFGDNVEHRFGHLPFLIFYLGSGLVGGLAHLVMNSDSILPSLGASGAISGVLGAYLVLFPWNRVYAIFVVWMVSLPAFVVIVMWFVGQLMGGFRSLSMLPGSGGVAYSAHIGGFLAGLAMALVLRNRMLGEPDTIFRRIYLADPQANKWW